MFLSWQVSWNSWNVKNFRVWSTLLLLRYYFVFRFGDYVNTSVTNRVFGDFFSRPKPREAQYVAFIFPAKWPITTELFSFISRKRVPSRT